MNQRQKLIELQRASKATYGMAVGSAEHRASLEIYVPTGSLSLDYVLGGGVRVGHIALFYGEKSSGKTSTIARVCGRMQGLCRNCYRPAKRDAWNLYEGSDALSGSGTVAVGDTGEAKVLRRIDAHEYLTARGMELVASGDDWCGYAGKGLARLVRLPGGVEAVEPSESEIRELGEDARWGAAGYCSCSAEGLYRPDDNAVPAKVSGEKPREYADRLKRWKAEQKLNSYDEVVVSWVDMENAYHRSWFGCLGVDNRRVMLMHPTDAESALDVCQGLAVTGEVDVLVIDSIAQLVPAQELVTSMEEWQQGLQARLVNKGMRRLVSAMNQNMHNRSRQFTQLWTNQTRTKINVRFGDPTVKPGGKGQDFAADAEVQFLPSKKVVVDEQYGTKDEVVNLPMETVISFKSTKNRNAGTDYVRGFYRQLARPSEEQPLGAIVEDDYVKKLAMHYLVVPDKKKGVYELLGEIFGSQSEILNRIREDRAFAERVKVGLLRKMLTSRGAGKPVVADE